MGEGDDEGRVFLGVFSMQQVHFACHKTIFHTHTVTVGQQFHNKGLSGHSLPTMCGDF